MRKWPRMFVLLIAFGVLVPMLVLVYRTPWQTSFKKDKQKKNIRMIDTSLFTDDLSKSQHNNPQHNWIHSQCDDLQLPVKKALKSTAFNHIIVNHKHKVLYCQVPKVACTNWRRVFIILSGKVDTNNPMSLKANEVHGNYDRYLTYLGDLSVEKIQTVLRDYFKFIIVREPFERLLSAYRNKLEGQTNSSRFFHQRFGRKIVKKYRDRPSEKSLVAGNDVTFAEFVQYILDPSRKDPLNEHWAQFYKLCHPCLINYDFVGKYHRLEKDSEFILKNIGVAEKIKFPPRSASYKHKKTESLLIQYYKTIPRRNLLKLMKAYQPDFVLFNYSLPVTIQSLIN